MEKKPMPFETVERNFLCFYYFPVAIDLIVHHISEILHPSAASNGHQGHLMHVASETHRRE